MLINPLWHHTGHSYYQNPMKTPFVVMARSVAAYHQKLSNTQIKLIKQQEIQPTQHGEGQKRHRVSYRLHCAKNDQVTDLLCLFNLYNRSNYLEAQFQLASSS